MAKAEKMTRGVKSKAERGGGAEVALPSGVHSVDGHGNIFASLPELGRVMPRYFTFDRIKSAVEDGSLTSLSAEDVQQIEVFLARK